MLLQTHIAQNSSRAFWGFSCLLIFGLVTSPALISIGVGGMTFSSIIWRFNQSEKNDSSISDGFLMGGMASIFLINLLAFGYGGDWLLWLKECQIKLPFLLLPIAFYFGPYLSIRQIHTLFIVQVIAVSGVSLVTLLNYLTHFDEINAQILLSKPMPVITLSRQISHIYYSLILAFTIWITVYLAVVSSQSRRFFYLAVCLFLIVCLHVFTARTGLLAFYGSIPGIILLRLSRIMLKRFEIASILLLMGCLGLVLFQLPSVKNRIQNTYKDVQFYMVNDNVTDWSLGTRLLTWKLSLDIIQENFWTGIGPANCQTELHAAYETAPVVLHPEKRLRDMHNQYLEMTAGFGILGGLLLLFVLGFPLVKEPYRIVTLLPELLLVTAFAMLGESILERQIGVSFFCFYYLLLIRFKPMRI